jgi:hypothetical protein
MVSKKGGLSVRELKDNALNFFEEIRIKLGGLKRVEELVELLD